MGNVGRPGVGLMRKAFDKVVDTVMRRETLGYDKLGNKYFRWYETKDGERVERRQVDWIGDYSYYDPNNVPSEWRMWLRKQRAEAPTEEEMAQSELKLATLKGKVQQLDEKERMRRLRAQAVGQQDSSNASAPPDMSRFLQQMNKDEKGPG